jgi:hypothetical protein
VLPDGSQCSGTIGRGEQSSIACGNVSPALNVEPAARIAIGPGRVVAGLLGVREEGMAGEPGRRPQPERIAAAAVDPQVEDEAAQPVGAVEAGDAEVAAVTGQFGVGDAASARTGDAPLCRSGGVPTLIG